MKLRALHSLLVSLNAHVWGLVLLSVAFVCERKPPEPQRIEVQFLRLSAPREGGSISRSVTIRPDNARQAARGDRRPEAARRKRGPRVEYRVRVAKTSAPVETRESGTWVPASRIRVRESELRDYGSRIAGVSPEAPPDADSRLAASGDGSAPGEQWPQGLDDEEGGDTRELIKIIQARIDAVTPLVHASTGPCRTERGVVHLKFLVNRAGYPRGFRVISYSGVRCLDEEIDNVLHMAEPYPYVAGWIPVTIRFTPWNSM